MFIAKLVKSFVFIGIVRSIIACRSRALVFIYIVGSTFVLTSFCVWAIPRPHSYVGGILTGDILRRAFIAPLAYTYWLDLYRDVIPARLECRTQSIGVAPSSLEEGRYFKG